MNKIYLSIGRSLNSPIYSLTKRNNNFGTGYEVLIDKENVTLQLMNGPSISGKVILELKAYSDKVEYGFIDDIVMQLEQQIFEIDDNE